jgi:uncharacterized protein
MNVFSSAVATVVFMWHGLVNYRLGLILGVAMFAGAIFGASFAIRLGDLRLRRIFLTAVWARGLKALVFDVFAKASGCDEAPSAAVHQKTVLQGVQLLDTIGLL